jgi:Putative beta-barrel porin-2, OmpL-like. bbp2
MHCTVCAFAGFAPYAHVSARTKEKTDMKTKFYGHKAASLLGGALLFAAGAAHADALSTPSMAGPLTANASPMSFDAGPLGTLYVTGAISGLALYQSDHTSAVGDHETLLDFTNGQVSVQKTTGLIQFYIQAGEYSLPSLGEPYTRASSETSATFGVVPVAYLKIAPTDTFSIEAGKLPTLIGAEYTFTFENLNIERGLLWNQEPAISRGVQANYAIGPVALSFSLNDGNYTNKYNQLSGSAAWTISPSDSVSFVGSGDLGKVEKPFPMWYHGESPVNSESVYNLIWTHTSGPWTITPYVQYTDIGEWERHHHPLPETSTWGGAVLVNYAFNPSWSLGGRVEYIDQSTGLDPVLYGEKSSAWSFTITPTYQYKVLFVRADLSYVTVSNIHNWDSSQTSPGGGFGTDGTGSDQFRAMLETGIVF